MHTIPYNNTIVADTEAIRLKAKSTLLFSSSSAASSVNANVCSILVNITNPLENEVVINVSTEGALLIKDLETNGKGNNDKKPKIQFATSTIGGSDESTTRPSTAEKDNESATVKQSVKSANTEGKVIRILPHVSPLFHHSIRILAHPSYQ
jgi:hypothetical protein